MKPEKYNYTVLDRVANQAARAAVTVIEQQTGKPLSGYNCMRLVNAIGRGLLVSPVEGGVHSELRAILDQPCEVDNVPDQPRRGDNQ